jgi:Ca2+-transporting ATPase
MSSAQSKLLVNEITKNKFIWFALLICTALMVLVYILPQTRLVLGLEVLPEKVWIISLIASLIPLVLIQLYKIIWDKKKVPVKGRQLVSKIDNTSKLAM